MSCWKSDRLVSVWCSHLLGRQSGCEDRGMNPKKARVWRTAGKQPCSQPRGWKVSTTNCTRLPGCRSHWRARPATESDFPLAGADVPSPAPFRAANPRRRQGDPDRLRCAPALTAAPVFPKTIARTKEQKKSLFSCPHFQPLHVSQKCRSSEIAVDSIIGIAR